MKDWNFVNPAVAAALLKRNKRLEKLKKAKEKPTAAQRLDAFHKKTGTGGPLSPPRSANSTNSAATGAASSLPRPPAKGKNGRPLPAWFMGPPPARDSAFTTGVSAGDSGSESQQIRPSSADVEIQSVHSDDGDAHMSGRTSHVSAIPHFNLAFSTIPASILAAPTTTISSSALKQSKLSIPPLAKPKF
jgi:hypothetical protein